MGIDFVGNPTNSMPKSLKLTPTLCPNHEHPTNSIPKLLKIRPDRCPNTPTLIPPYYPYPPYPPIPPYPPYPPDHTHLGGRRAQACSGRWPIPPPRTPSDRAHPPSSPHPPPYPPIPNPTIPPSPFPPPTFIPPISTHPAPRLCRAVLSGSGAV